MSLFENDSYKQILKDRLQYKKINVSGAFTYEKLARGCGVQKTYLSRVLNSDTAHLSEEQLERASHFLGLQKNEREYLQLLRRRDRTQNAEIRGEWQQDIAQLRKMNLQTDQYLNIEAQKSSLQDWSPYYLDPYVMLVHIFLTIEGYRKDVRRIAQVLNLSDERLAEVLRELEKMQLVIFTDAGYQVTQNKTHLSRESALYRSFRSLQRLRALEKMDKLKDEKVYSFSVAFSSCPKIRSEIQRRILNLISEIEELVAGHPEEEVYQLNIDLFDWT